MRHSQNQAAMQGGLRVPGYKALSRDQEVLVLDVPPVLVLPLRQHIGSPAEPVVQVGDRVLRGQLIAKPEGYVSAPVHASSSGTVVAIECRPVPHPSGLNDMCIIIETDGMDDAIAVEPESDYQQLESSHLRNIVRHAGVVGMGGAGFPTFIKLNPPPGSAVETLILNGAECEPFITCDDRLMRDWAGEIIAGAKIIRHAVQASRCVIGIEDNKPEAIAAMQAAAGDDIEVVAVPTVYPLGGEKQLVLEIVGLEVPADGIPAEVGVLMQNVATAMAVYRAVVLGQPLTARYVTVTGGGVEQPRNLLVRNGTPFKHLLAACGGPSDDTRQVIMGGSMMGFAVPDLEVPVVKTTNCIIAATSAEIEQPPEAMPCIRCGACSDVCPVDLLPQQLYWYSRAKDLDAVQDYNLFDCIECGCCAYVCPSRIPLVSYYRYAKTAIAERERAQARAEVSRRRVEFHNARLEREKRERELKREQKKAAMKKKAEAAAAARSAAEKGDSE